MTAAVMFGNGAMRYLSVPRWSELQHYKNRSPPWIKLHAERMESYEFHCLQDASKAHLVGIMVLASHHRNRIPDDPKWIGERIGATTPVDTELLVSLGFLLAEQDASAPLASVKQGASPEGEREGEKRKPSAVPAAGPPDLGWDLPSTPAADTPKTRQSPRGNGKGGDAESKVTWLTPYFDLYRATKGTPSAGQLAKVMKPIEDEIGVVAALEVLETWLGTTDVKFGLVKFGEHWKDFLPPRIKLLPNGDPTPETVAMLTRAFGGA